MVALTHVRVLVQVAVLLGVLDVLELVRGLVQVAVLALAHTVVLLGVLVVTIKN